MGRPGKMLSANYDMRSQESSILAAMRSGPLQSLTERELGLREQAVTVYPHALQRRVWAWVRFGPDSIRVAAKLMRSTSAAAGIEFRASEKVFRCWVWGNAVVAQDEAE